MFQIGAGEYAFFSASGLLGFLFNKANNDKAEKGGFEFSLGNLLKCMCFTHEDEENPKKQLVKIAGHLDDVTSRY